jgi:hypothetical protein
MMGGRAFILLKAGRIEPECSEHAEIRIANLQKILRIPLWRPKAAQRVKTGGRPDFREIWII